jgi:uncharacterized protein with GYD domain
VSTKPFLSPREVLLCAIWPWKIPRPECTLKTPSTQEEKMPLFITYASYSHSGVKGLVNKPEDRSGAVKALIEKAGGKLVALYNTTGSNDVVLVSELADGSDAVAMGMAVAASGALAKIETVRAWTPSEFKGIAEKAARVASAYTPPGK